MTCDSDPLTFGVGSSHRPRPRVKYKPPTLGDILRVHGENDLRRGRPAFSKRFRSQVAASWRDFQRRSALSDARLAAWSGIDAATCRTLREGTRVPSWRTVVRMMSVGAVDWMTGETNVALARVMGERVVVRRTRPGPYVGWGVADALVAWRRARGFTQRECFDVLGAPDPPRLSHWEHGHSLPGPNSLARLVELRVVDRSIARAILDSDHYASATLAQATPEALRIIRG